MSTTSKKPKRHTRKSGLELDAVPDQHNVLSEENVTAEENITLTRVNTET